MLSSENVLSRQERVFFPALCCLSFILWFVAHFTPQLLGIHFPLPEDGRLLIFPAPHLTLFWVMISLLLPIGLALYLQVFRKKIYPYAPLSQYQTVSLLVLLPLSVIPLLFRLHIHQQLVANIAFYVPVVVFSILLLRSTEKKNLSVQEISNRLIIIVGVFFLLFYWLVGYYFTLSSGEHSGDEGHYIIQAESLHEDRDLDLFNNFDTNEQKYILRGQEEHLHISPTSQEGKFYSWHPFGLPLYLSIVPADNLILRHLLLGLFSGLGSAGLLLLLRIVGITRNTAILFTMLTSLSAIWGIYSCRVLPEIPGAVLAIWCAIGVLSAIHSPWRSAALIIFCCGYLPFLHQRFVPVSFFGYLFLAVTLFKNRSSAHHFRALLFATTGLCLLAGLYLYINSQLFTTGVSYTPSQFIFYPAGLVDVLISNQGISYILPSFLWCIAAAIIVLIRGYQPHYLLFSLLCFIGVLVLSCSNHGWTGGASTWGRYLVAVYPLFLPLAALCFDRTNRIARWWFIFLSLISVFYFFFLLLRLPHFQANFGDPRFFIGVIYHYFTGLFDPFPTAEKIAFFSFTSPDGLLFIITAILLTLLLILRRKKTELLLYPLIIAAVGIYAHHPENPPTWSDMDYRKQLLSQRHLARQLLSSNLDRTLLFSITPQSERPILETSNLFVLDRGKNLSSVTTDKTVQNEIPNSIYQPEMDPNDWQKRPYFWTTLGSPFDGGGNKALFSLTGEIRGKIALELLVIELGGKKNNVIFSREYISDTDRFPVQENAILQPTGDGMMHILVRIASGTGAFISDRLGWTPVTDELLQKTKATLPDGITK